MKLIFQGPYDTLITSVTAHKNITSNAYIYASNSARENTKNTLNVLLFLYWVFYLCTRKGTNQNQLYQKERPKAI